MDGARDQLLAAAVRAADEHAARGRGGGGDLLAEPADRRALPDDLGALGEALAQDGVLAREPRVLERPRDGEQHLFERERLLDEVVRAELGGLHGGLDRAVPGDHHDDRVGPDALELGERLEPVHALHPDVEDGEVWRLVGDDPERVRTAADSGDAVPLVFQDAAHRRLDRGLVVDDQDMLAGHVTSGWGALGTGALSRAGYARRPSATPRPARGCATRAPR